MPARAALGLFYLTCFAVLGVYLPYFPLYLESLGFDPFQIAAVAATLPFLRACAPIVWGVAADRSGRRRQLTILAAALSLAAFILLLRAASFPAVCLIMALYSAVNSGTLPLVEATALEVVGGRGGYGATRVWGSIGFILFAVAWGWLLDAAGLRWVVFGLVGLSALNFAATFGVPEAAPHPRALAGERLHPAARRAAALFFAATLLQQASHGPYYVYFSLHLESLGWTKAAIGGAWVVGVLSEVLLMLASERLAARWGAQALLLVSQGAACLRWGALAWISSPLAILMSQTLHSLTFGTFHVAAVGRTQALFPPGRRAIGQALYSALTYGAGNVLGMVGGGLLHDWLGVRGLLAAAAAAALAGLVVQAAAARAAVAMTRSGS
jgi:PPP family 3-phenylpropionic acid transporter